MNILAIADEESKSLWDHFSKDKLAGVDLIISCGDLNPKYLEFLTTMTNVPVFYVHGNHDARYMTDPPLGCVCIEDRVVNFRGVRIMGLGGSMKYNPGKPFQYTDWQMKTRVYKMTPQLFFARGIDILVTHAPALGLNDDTDLPHRGFEVFNDLLEAAHPKYFLHGHVHMSYGRQFPRHCMHGGTHVINAYERVIFTYEDEHPEEHFR